MHLGSLFKRFASNLIDISTLQKSYLPINFPPHIHERLSRWNRAKELATHESMSPRVDRISVLYNGHPMPETLLSMAKGISTPYDCTKHLSQMLRDRSALAFFNGEPYDMHRPFLCEGKLDFLHFKDIHHDPTTVNEAFWRSCQFLLAATLESSFKNEFDVRLMTFPQTSLNSGSFVADISISVPYTSLNELIAWKPNSQDLRMLSESGQKLANARLPFEFLETTKSEAEIIINDNVRLKLAEEEFHPQSARNVALYKIGDYIQVSGISPMISSTGFIGRFSVTSMKLLGQLSKAHMKSDTSRKQLIYRVQGIAVPTAFLTHFTTFDVLRRRAQYDNPDLSLPFYAESLEM